MAVLRARKIHLRTGRPSCQALRKMNLTMASIIRTGTVTNHHLATHGHPMPHRSWTLIAFSFPPCQPPCSLVNVPASHQRSSRLSPSPPLRPPPARNPPTSALPFDRMTLTIPPAAAESCHSRNNWRICSRHVVYSVMTVSDCHGWNWRG